MVDGTVAVVVRTFEAMGQAGGTVKRAVLVAVALAGAAAAAFAVTFLGGSTASAAPACTMYWTGHTSGAFATAGNWSLTNGGTSAGRTPAAADFVCMSTAPTTAAVTSAGTVSVAGINWPTVGAVAPGLTLTGGTFTVGTATSAQASTINSLTVQGGKLAGKSAISSSALTLSYGTLNGTGSLTLAPGGTGTLGDAGNVGVTISGGYHLVNQGNLSTTTDVVNGYNTYLSFQNASTFENSGNLTLTDNVQFGYLDATANLLQNDTTGTINYQGATTVTINVPLVDNGAINVGAGGTVSLAGGGTMGPAATQTGVGTLSLDGGTLTASSGSTFSALRIHGGMFSGTSTVTAHLALDYGTLDGSGTLTLAATGTGTLGAQGNQGITLSGGFHLVNQGTLTTFSDPIDGWFTYLYLYNASTVENAGTLTLADQTAFYDQDVTGNLFRNDAGKTVNFAGPTTDYVAIPFTNNGAVNVIAGTLVAGQLTNLAAGVLTGGTYTLSGTLDVGAAITTNAATVTVNPGGKLASGSTNALSGLRVNSGSLTLGQSLAYSAALANSGVLVLTAGTLQPTSYTQSAGTTTVAAGAGLRAGAAGTGTVTVNGGTLTGNGSVIGTIGGSGIVQPGTAVGPLSLVGPYAPTAAGTLAIGIRGPSTPGTDFGQLSVTGAAHVAGGLALTTAPTFNPSPGTVYTILSASSLTGTFGTVSGQIDQAAGVYYSVSYTATSVVLTVTALPTLFVGSAGVAAPVSGTVTMNVPVALSAASPFTTTATFATSNGTAVAGVDYTTTTGTVTVPAGITTASIPVTVLAQATYGPTRTFTVTLSAPSNATLGTSSATGNVTNSNPMPSLSIAPASVNAPITGTSTVNVGVTLSAPSQFATTVNFATSDGTAVAGTDYTATAGTLTFPAGTTSKAVGVTILARPTSGPTKTFTVTLSSPGNASIATPTSSVSVASAVTSGPSVTAVSPNALPVGAANKTLTVTGTGFTNAEVPSFSAAGITVVSKAFVSSTTVKVKVTVGAATPVGPTDVTVTTAAGAGTCTGCLSINPVPKVTTIAPVPALGKSTLLTVTGSGFQAGLVPTTTIPGATFGAVTGQTATTFQVQLTVPLTDVAGNYNIVITNPDGGKATKLVAVPPVPTVTSVAPNAIGAASTGVVLTVTGTGFNATEVPTFSVAGFKVVTKTYVSPTTITLKVNTTATTPLGAATVTITTSGGAGACVGCLTVDAAPKITKINPVPAHGASTVLTVTGTGLQAGLVVTSTVPGATFGPVTGQNATTFQVQITIPPSTVAGTYNLVVINPDGGKVTKAISVS
jgi:hypothetical protein